MEDRLDYNGDQMEKKKVKSQGIWLCVGGFIRMVCSGLSLSLSPPSRILFWPLNPQALNLNPKPLNP